MRVLVQQNCGRKAEGIGGKYGKKIGFAAFATRKVQTEVAFHQRGDHITVGVLPRPEFGFQHRSERTGTDGFAGLLDIGRIKNGLRLKKIKISAFFRQFPKQGGKFPNPLKPAAVSNAQRR